MEDGQVKEKFPLGLFVRSQRICLNQVSEGLGSNSVYDSLYEMKRTPENRKNRIFYGHFNLQHSNC